MRSTTLLMAAWLATTVVVAPEGVQAANTGPGATSAVMEHFNDAEFGTVPAGWGTDTSGGTVGVAAVPDAVDRSLRLTKTATDAASSTIVERRTTAGLTGVVEAEVRVRVDSAVSAFNVLYVASRTGVPVASIGIRAGRYYNAGPNQTLAAASQGWHVVRVELRTDDQTFDLHVDGAKLLDAAPFRTPAADVGRLTFGLGPGATNLGTMWVDNVSLRRVPEDTAAYQAKDLFDDVPVGTVAPGYVVAGGGGTVDAQPVPSDADRSLRITKTTSTQELTATRALRTPQKGVVMVQANLRTESTTGVKMALYIRSSTGRISASLQFSNSVLQYVSGGVSHVLLSGVQPGEWYTVRLVLDVPGRQFVAYADGRRFPAVSTTARPTHFPFRDPAAADVAQLVLGVGAGQVGTLYADKVLAYPVPDQTPTGPVVDVRSFGATGNGTTDDTAAVQAAVNATPTGGSVLLSGGVFRTGTIMLKSDMTFFVAPDAMLLGTWDDAAYPSVARIAPSRPFVGGVLTKALLFSHRANNLTIEGGGVIHGNGTNPAWAGGQPGPAENHRPAGMFLTSGSNVTIRDIYLKDAAFWGIVPAEIDGLTITDVAVDGNIDGNRDGIDVVDGHDVLIERVDVYSDDDSICFKSHFSTSQRVSSRGVVGAVVRLSSVSASGRANGVKLGTASDGAFADITVEDVLVKRPRNAGIVVTEVGGGTVTNARFRRVTIDQTQRAIFVLIGRRTGAPDPRWISGLRFEDITATRIADAAPNHLATGAVLSGTKESTGATYGMYDILLSNVKVNVTVGGSVAPQTPNEYNGDYPESTRWPYLAAYGFSIRHADGVTLRNSSATLANPGARPMTATVDVLTYATG